MTSENVETPLLALTLALPSTVQGAGLGACVTHTHTYTLTHSLTLSLSSTTFH
jgi:hypothetical protein